MVSYLGDCANCCAAVTASSSEFTSRGSLLQPGCFRIRSSCFTVRSTVAFEHKSTLLMTMKKGTLRAMAKPKCSRVVPAAGNKWKCRCNSSHHCCLFMWQLCLLALPQAHSRVTSLISETDSQAMKNQIYSFKQNQTSVQEEIKTTKDFCDWSVCFTKMQ